MVGQPIDRLRLLKEFAENEMTDNASVQAADWCRTVSERLDNSIFEVDQVSDALCAMDSNLPEFNRSWLSNSLG